MSEPVWWCRNCHRVSKPVCTGCNRSHDVIDLVAVYEATLAFNTGGGGAATGERLQRREALRKALGLAVDP